MGWQDDLSVAGEVREWWADVRGPLAYDVRRKLLKTALALGVAATLTMKAAGKLERWIP